MAISKLEKNISKDAKTKNKTVINSTKFTVVISIMGLAGFVVILMFGISIFSDSAQKTVESESEFSFIQRGVVSNNTFVATDSNLPEILDSDPVRGAVDPVVTIVEFGDYECSHCANMQTTMKRILNEYPEDVELVWKDLPTASSADAALAGRCAQLQGKFWEMQDLLFENSLFLNRGRITDIGKSLDLNVDLFNDCIDSGLTAPLVQSDIDQAAQLAVDGTPYFFINDQEISGTISYNDLKNMIDIELGK